KTFTIENGLPSSKIYDIIQDSKGYIWFATDYGVSQFDGEIFTNYSVLDQLVSNTIIQLFLDEDGILYFLNANGQINLFNQSVQKFAANEIIKKKLNGEVADHFVIQNKQIDLTTTSGKHYFIKGNEVEVVNENTEKLNYFYFLPQNEYYVWGKCECSTERRIFDSNIKKNGDTIFVALDYEYKEIPAFTFNQVNAEKNEYILSINNNLYFIEKDTVITYSFERFINDIFIDQSGDLWVSVNQMGIYYYKNQDLSQSHRVLFKEKNILKTFQDREGIYWLISDNEGIINFRTLDFSIYNDIRQNILSMDVKGNKLLFSTYENEIYECRIHKNEILDVSKIEFDTKSSSLIEDVLLHEDGSFWILYSNFNKFTSFGTSFPVDLTAINYSSFESGDGRRKAKYIAQIEFEDSKISYTPSFGIYRGKQFSIYTDNRGKIWLKTLEGIFSSIGFNLKFFELTYDESKNQLTDFESTNEYLVLGTRNSGLRILSIQDDLININSETHSSLPSNAIRKIFIDSSAIWIGTNNGICRLLRSQLDKNDIKITPFKSSGGFPINEVNDIVRQHDIVWVGGNNGLLSFYPDEIKAIKSSPILSFNRISINDIDTLIMNNYSLDPRQNTLTFSFKAISINASQDMLYKYRLIGLDSTWIISKNNLVRYPKLQAGKYQLVIYCSSDGVNWNDEFLSTDIFIKKHFTKTVLFGVLTLLLFLIVAFLITYWILRSQKRKNQNEKNFLQAEISSLRSQMNPHFIYNCMNSIQGYVVRNENNLAIEYIDNFARLLRTVVQSSRKQFITLELELATLAQYLELEKLRFSWKFDYGIVIDSNVDTTAILIPPLLIQPFVENSIQHGFATKKENSLITITVDDEETNIIVTVEDNGIGRVKAAETTHKRRNYKSVGVQNIHERISMLNKIYSSNITLNINDLYTEDKKAIGTRVTLEIPQLIKLSEHHE
ncbi:MAG: histidine kinase, partial [Bacteroidetes bacterium]|nr:histidine kinase [Bacteroidota bacterium]